MAAASSSVSPSKAPVLPSPARFQTLAKPSFGKEARQVVLNVYYKLRCESPNESYKAIVQRTSELTRVGYSTIFTWKKLVQSSPDGPPSVPSPLAKKKEVCPAYTKSAGLFRPRNFPKISRTTLWKALVDLGFTFIKRNRDSLLMERTDLQAIQEWLTDNDIVWDPTFLKAELLNLVERAELTMPGLQKYRIDDIAEQHGHSVLPLPPYHCELNNIELVWSQVKGSIAGANKTFKLAEVELLTPVALQQVTPDNWKAYARHVINAENKMWEADCLSDTVIDSVVIHLGSDDDKSAMRTWTTQAMRTWAANLFCGKGPDSYKAMDYPRKA
ncbi:hypothetical protein HPB47_027771, partial [Ixodes persulcatus]